MLDAEAALQEGAPLVHQAWEQYRAAGWIERHGNDCGLVTQVKGDIERELRVAGG